ncbi:DMT family transporter [Streptococcus sp. DD12]|uniref:DMT family transporter n=1 Tax=Streptococcus sp. DD12 TaxID=1777880 RepID=UPI0007995081|nr:DMT family transporter [Streptococcus sp. DD12]KXT76935.1 Drug/metabolite transporter (DMT) superfamily protein [Streptococcus sp. DD12]
MNAQVKGSLITLIAAICWGISGVSGQYLMANGVPINLLSSLRLLIAGTILTVCVVLTDKTKLARILHQKKDLWLLVAFGIFGLMLNQYAYLQAIHYTNAGTATVLQYVTPVLILLFTCLVSRRLPSLIELVAILLAISGTYIMATHGQIGELAVTPIGLFWGLLSAVTYSLYILMPAGLIRKHGSFPVIGPAMLVAGLVFSLSTQSWRYPLVVNGPILLAYFGIIGIGTIIAYTLFLKGTAVIGAVKGSLIASVEPISAVFFSVLIMHDIFYPVDFIGMTAILLAVILISLKDLLALRRVKMAKRES